MNTQWKKLNDIICATINGNQYEVYETEPGIQRLRRNGRLIAETFTTEEAKRWAESYDIWLEQEAPKLPKNIVRLPKITPFSELLESFDDAKNWKRFPCYPNEMGAAND